MDAGKPYHLWLRMKADNNSTTNDSVFVQFTNSRDETGASAWRIGTTSALIGYLEEGSGAGVSGWGWADNAYGYRSAHPVLLRHERTADDPRPGAGGRRVDRSDRV